MSQKNNFYNINNLDEGIKRKLGEGLETSIFCGDQAMISVVTIEPNCVGQIHSHPEEQWGVMLEGSGIRIQGGERIEIKNLSKLLLIYESTKSANHGEVIFNSTICCCNVYP